MLRQIGANALGYAFKLALSSMCDDCDKILSELQDKMDALNRMQVDTCKWGAGLTVNAAEAMGFKVEEKYKMETTGAGSFDDTFAAMRSLFEDPGQDKANGSATGADPNNKDVGNYTWKALTDTNAAVNFAFLSGNIDHIELLMNISGSLIIRGPAAAELENGDVVRDLEARLTYEELKNGKDASAGSANDALPLVECGNVDCTSLTAVAQWSFQNGIRGWVGDQLQQAADHMKNPATASLPHPPATQQFIGSLPFTVMTHMMVMQGNVAGLDQYVQLMTPYITKVYSARLARQLTGVVRRAYDSSETPTMTQQVRDNLKTFEQSALEDERAVEKEYHDVWKKAEELVARHTNQYGEDAIKVTKRN